MISTNTHDSSNGHVVPRNPFRRSNCNGAAESTCNGHCPSVSTCTARESSALSVLDFQSTVLGHHSSRRKTRHEINIELRRKSAENCRCEQRNVRERRTEPESGCFRKFIPQCLIPINKRHEVRNSAYDNRAFRKYSTDNRVFRQHINEQYCTTIEDRLDSSPYWNNSPCSCSANSDGGLNAAEVTGTSGGEISIPESITLTLPNDNTESESTAKFYLGNLSRDLDEITYL